ncbi:MAG: hypothetical protein LBT30_05570 [Clostridiales bacterium]|jgi:superoxide reductase|nr:hypothetical protein [Clostridiales bacterium]
MIKAKFYISNENVIFYDTTGNGTGGDMRADLKALNADANPETCDRHELIREYMKDGLRVKIGKTPHEMTVKHYIKWVFVETKDGASFRNLEPINLPEAWFPVAETDVVDIYAYCNLHGLLKSDVPENKYNQASVSPEFTGGVRK